MSGVGLVIGKLWPPHAGHHHLIDVALARCDVVHVVVCEKPDQEPSGARRAAWVREEHPEAVVHVTADDLPDAPEPWAARTRRLLGRPPDTVFTSEAYGDEFARILGAAHHLVDLERRAVPTSGTEVRRDPAAAWPYLRAGARAFYATRVVVVGAESTGTTTLARALADHYRTEWVPEVGREWSERKAAEGTFGTDAAWTTGDFVEIARLQQAAEDAAARRSGPVLVCDTDALATAVWHERYLGARSPEVEEIAASRSYALYVLTADDIPFVQDGLRDGEHLRAWMTDRFREELRRRREPHVEVRGSHDERLALAVAAIDAQLRRTSTT